jgi:hypothetical protein
VRVDALSQISLLGKSKLAYRARPLAKPVRLPQSITEVLCIRPVFSGAPGGMRPEHGRPAANGKHGI